MYQMSRVGPGPAAYKMPTTVGFPNHDVRKERKPMFSMRGRQTTRYETIGPGPAHNLGKMTNVGRPYNASYSLGRRFMILKAENIPGPGAHNVLSIPGSRSPAFSIGIRLNESTRDMIPGPNQYNTEKLNVYKNRSPIYSMGARTNLANVVEGPGPNAYSNLDRNITHTRNPRYTIRKRYSNMEDNCRKPGPNSYNLMELKPGASAPKYSFGVRHSMWNPPMIIPGDNC